MLLKIRLTFVCKYKYSKQTSNSLEKKKSNFLADLVKEKKKPSRTRVKDFLRLYYKALTVTDANIQLKCKIEKKRLLNYQQLFISYIN